MRVMRPRTLAFAISRALAVLSATPLTATAMVVAGIVLNAQPVFAAERPVSFQGTDLGWQIKTFTVPARLYVPKGAGPFPAVVILPHCGGMISNVTSLWPNYLTKLGYATLVVDMLGARGLKSCNKKLFGQERSKTRKEFDLTLTQDAYGALAYLATLPEVDKKRIGVMGLSLGSFVISHFVSKNLKTSDGVSFKAAVSLYFKCDYLNPVEGMMPLAIINGEYEAHQDGCRQKKNAPSVELHELPNTYHAFDNALVTKLHKDIVGNKMLYSENATNQAQAIVREFLAKNL